MAAGALVATWGPGIPGREAKALEVFAAAVEMAEGFAKEGRIYGHREYLHTNRQGGMMVIDGDVDALQEIRNSDEFRKVTTKASMIVGDFRMDLMSGGTDEAVQHAMAAAIEAEQELGLI